LAAELEKALGIDASLLPSGGGVFEITVDGKRIFSKKQLGRFPEDNEVLGLIRAAKKD
jgi:selenoprotein W-related protein